MRKRKSSIQKELLFYFCVLIFSSVVLLAVILSFNTSQIVLGYTAEEISNGLEQVENSVDDRLGQSVECFSSIILDDNITKTLKEKNDIDTSIGFSKAYEVSRRLRLLKQSYPYVSAIYIYDVKNQCYYHSENTIINEQDFRKTEHYKTFIETEDYSKWKPVMTVPGMPWGQTKGYLTCAIPMKENIEQEIFGYVFISIDIEEMFKYIEDFEIINSEELFWVSSDNKVLDSTVNIPNEVLEKIEKNENGKDTSVYIGKLSKYLYIRQSKETDIKYCMLIPYHNIRTPIYKIWKIALLCMIPILWMAFFLSYIFSKRMYRPMETLLNHMKKAVIVEEKETLINEKRNDEFGVLYTGFNQMLIENGELLKELSEEQEKQKLIELRLFQEQINPHFLYNTLNSIYCLSNLYEIQEISELSKDLINFYRMSLNHGKEMISVENTIRHIQYYIRIQNVRYKGRYKLDIDVKEHLFEIQIPKLLVQPLVENAIEHGLKNAKYDPCIKIEIVQEDKDIVITVSDHGCGMGEKKLQEIRYILDGNVEDEEKAFALKNIHDRIRLYYGEEGRMSIFSEPGKGTKIEIRIPVEQKGEVSSV